MTENERAFETPEAGASRPRDTGGRDDRAGSVPRCDERQKGAT
jgi:hypothetical protein